MAWQQQIFAYCERGLDPGFWAEPLNAVSNAAFLIAAAIAFAAWQRERVHRPALVELALLVLVAVIGVGSFLFHTYATRWAVIADVLPITVFMIAYLAYALRRLVRLSWLGSGMMLALFVLSLWGAESVDCGARPCLNGSAGYLPALAALGLIGGWLVWSGHAAGRLIATGAAVFLVSLTLRTLDRDLCAATAFLGARRGGTHFLWHVCNATLLGLLLIAAVRHGGKGLRR